jgi:hypothetical protein
MNRIRKVSLDSILSGRPELHCEAHVSSPRPSQPSAGQDNEDRQRSGQEVSKVSCANESELLTGFLSHLRVSAIQVEPSRGGLALPGCAQQCGGVEEECVIPTAVLASWSGARRTGH